VSPNNKVEIMATKKLTNYIPPKGERYSAVIFIPTLAKEKKKNSFKTRLWQRRNPGLLLFCTYGYGRIRVSPENVTEETSVRNITRPGNISDLFHLAQFRTQTPMHADDFIVNHSCAR
jgi:hypothetical protein